ncbi:phosphoribosylanthranilate isomerase [Pararhodonellum marinum]|uniref:phosphoribosylanthranilate isomerase n=1 Tax=Pararhodonellum marinum TaxID=2755358 RepID=UPI00188E23D8|nr:phosphoribosylanthranilate isomerase [Pararhodonellum marinum]
MLLKVCGMREKENITELAQQVNPDLVGLIFYPPSKRFVGLDNADFYKAQNHIVKVGVFVNAPMIDVLDRIDRFGLDFVQLHGGESAVYAQEMKKNTPVKIIKVYGVGNQINWSYLSGFEPHVDYFLFDTHTIAYGGSGKKFNWEMLKTYPLNKPFLISGGIALGDWDGIEKLKKEIGQLAGLDVNSKFEIAPGVKDISKLKKLANLVKQSRSIS